MENNINTAQVDEKPVTLLEGKVIAKRHDWSFQSSALLDDAPSRAARGVLHLTVDSLLDYTRREAEEAGMSPRVYVSNDEVCAVINHAGTDGSPHWGDHTATFSLRYSNEWKSWAGLFNEWISQAALAEHLEDYACNIKSPSGADVLQLIQQFRLCKNVTFGTTYTSQEGQTELHYQKDDAKGHIKLPESLLLHLPVYEGAEELTTYEIKVRLKHRVDEEGKKVIFQLVPVRLDIPKRQAMIDIANDIKEKGFPDTYVGIVRSNVSQTLTKI